MFPLSKLPSNIASYLSRNEVVYLHSSDSNGGSLFKCYIKISLNNPSESYEFGIGWNSLACLALRGPQIAPQWNIID